jgi:hypothetical protein
LTKRLRRSWSVIGRGVRWSIMGAFSVVIAILVMLVLLPRPAGGPAATGSTPPESSVLGGSSVRTSGSATPDPMPSGSGVGASAGPSTSTPNPTAKPTAKPTSTPAPTAKPVPTPPAATGAIQHIIWVWLENTEYGSVTASSMPYLTNLAGTYGLATNYFAIGHDSEMNYVSSVAGQHGSVTNGTVNIAFKSLWDQLNGDWRVYAQDIPSSCYTGSSFSGPVDGPGMAGTYVVHHNPAMVFKNVAAGGCNGHVFPLAPFDPTAARFIFVTPNQCNNAHDSCKGKQLPNADAFLRAFVPKVAVSPDFAHTILFITFDEGGSSAGLHGDAGGHVYTAVVAPWLSHVTSNLYLDHYSLLRTVEDTFGLPCLVNACQRTAMTPFLP